MLALKSVEAGGKNETYILVFDPWTGQVIMPEQRISADQKYEGVMVFASDDDLARCNVIPAPAPGSDAAAPAAASNSK